MTPLLPQKKHVFYSADKFKGCIDFNVENEIFSGNITKISRNAVVCMVEASSLKKIEIDDMFEKNPIYINYVLVGRANLKIVKIDRDNNDFCTLTAESVDTQASSLLWEITYKLNSGYFTELDLKEKKIKPEEIAKIPGRGIYTEKARLERLKFTREHTPGTLEQVEKNCFDPEKLTSNIESFIGSVEIPVGIAGPLVINGNEARGVFYSPMATSEGALVASISRGATALTRSGGVTTQVLSQRMLRAPLFCFPEMKSALFFAAWIRDHFNDIKECTKKYSNYADLKELDPLVLGNSVHVHFIYETGDAAGQNMTTTCTWNACLWILKQMENFKDIQVLNFWVDGNSSNDKKVTFQSFIKGRGIRVQAEAFLSRKVLGDVLKVTPEQMSSGWIKGVAGTIQSGMVGSNLNVANTIAAMFTCLGQDIASVHESSVAHFNIEPADEGIYASIMLPSLTIGTVGGGTNLPQQKECLEMLGCAGPGKAHKLAEIIAAFALSLELSTGAAMAAGQFASAHERLGRNRTVNHLKRAELDNEFFENAIRVHAENPDLEVLDSKPLKNNIDTSESILSQLTARQSNRLVGHFPYSIRLKDEDGSEKDIEVMLKIKPTDVEVIHMLNSMGALSDARLSAEMKKSDGKTGFAGCHKRELAVSAMKDPRIAKYMPETYGIFSDDKREAYVIIQELMKDMVLMDSADDVSGWHQRHILTAIDGIAEIHSLFYNNTKEIENSEWIDHWPTSKSMTGFTKLWRYLAMHANQEFPEWFMEDDVNIFSSIINDLPNWWGRIDSMPKTMIHNDFNPRNLAFRDTDSGMILCAYDWELATIHLPQHDLVELLAFVLDDQSTIEDIRYFSEYHRKMLEKYSEKEIDENLWFEGLCYSLRDFMINRLLSYIMVHTLKHYNFMERVYKTAKHILIILEKDMDKSNSIYHEKLSA